MLLSPYYPQVSDVEVTGETSVELDFEGSYARVTIFNTLSGNTTDSLYSPLQLYVFIPSLAEGNVQMLTTVTVKAWYLVFALLEKE